MTLWKSVECAIAEILGGKRVPITGRNRGDAPDIEHDTLSPEVKQRKKLPDWLHDAMDQAVKSSEGRLPIVVLHETGKHHKNDLVMLRLGDFAAETPDEFLARLREAGL